MAQHCGASAYKGPSSGGSTDCDCTRALPSRLGACLVISSSTVNRRSSPTVCPQNDCVKSDRTPNATWACIGLEAGQN